MRHAAESILRKLSVVAFALAATAPTMQVGASSGGYTGASTSGCSGCHGSVADPNMTLALSGATSLAAGASATYTLTATKSGVSGQPMGLDVTTSDGAGLATIAGQSTQLIGQELTHASPPRTVSGTTGTYQFTFTMPAGAAAGTAHTLRAASAIDIPGGWQTTTYTVYVPPTAPSGLAASSIQASSVTLSWTGGGPAYRIVYKTGGAPTSPTDGSTLNVSSSPTTVTGLAPATQYYFAVYSKVSAADAFSTTATTTNATTASAPAVNRYVNAGTGTNSGNCTVAGSPCRTITYAMTQAATGSPGDTINVAPGTYNQALGEAFPITIKNGVAVVGTGGDPYAVVVDATGANKQLFNVGTANSSTRLEGVTVKGGRMHAANGTDGYGGGMVILPNVGQAAEIRVLRNVFIDNEVRGANGDVNYNGGNSGYGGAIMVSVSTGGAPLISNNVFVNNRALGGNGFGYSNSTPGWYAGSGFGGAISAAGSSGTSPNAVRIINNTFHGNLAQGGNGGASVGGQGGDAGAGIGGALHLLRTILRNNIFAANTAAGGTPGTGSPAGAANPGTAGAVFHAVTVTSANNLFFASTPSASDSLGTSAVQADPLFHGAPNNLRITASSPAAGAGNATESPTNDLDNVTRPSPPAIGAFEPSSNLAFNLVLEGYQQVAPYVATPASGSGTATYSTASKQLTFNLAYSGLTGAEAMAHVHGPAARGANAGILHNLSGSNPKTDTVVLTAQQETQLLAGQLYVNIHTSTHGNGELRAQIDNVGATVTRALTVSKAGSGSGTVSGTTEAGTVVNCGSDCGEAIPNGKAATLTATPAAGSTFASWSGACTGTGQCVVTMDAAKAVTATFDTAAPPNPPRLGNIATRMQVLTGADVMIAGFVIGGSAAKTVVVRARGPSLTAAGVPGALGNPQLQFFSGSTQIAFNDNWADAANSADLMASGFAPGEAAEAAILTTLGPGPYTAIVSGVGGTTGVAIVEVFEVDAITVPLINIATRGRVLTDANVMIGGFIIQGSGPQTVVVRARGPSLTSAGVPGALGNPLLQLFSGSTQIQSNDNWGDAANAADITASGFAPAEVFESAILVTLQPGA